MIGIWRVASAVCNGPALGKVDDVYSAYGQRKPE
jgi:hypothetical protein